MVRGVSEATVIPRHVGVTESRVAVSWEGVGEPIVLRVYGPDGEVAVPLLPKRALELARELLDASNPLHACARRIAG